MIIMWRIWTRGFGPRDWWHWFREQGFPMWVAWRLPHRIALWAFIRVYAKGFAGTPGADYQRVYEAWTTPCE